VIYFIQNTLNQAVKIGTSGQPSRRLSALRTASPDPLAMLGVIPGNAPEEADLHRRFASWRITGEWFRGERELLDAIQQLMAAPEPRPVVRNWRDRWCTVRNNAIRRWLVGQMAKGPDSETLRVVFSDGPVGDIAYVVPCDDDNGNSAARLIAASPSMFRLCEAAIKQIEADSAQLGREADPMVLQALRATVATINRTDL